jgi:hypothetical protein
MLALVACGGSDAADVTVASSPPTAPTPVEPSPSTTSREGSDAAAVPTALDFNAPLVGGGEIEMGAYAGRPVLLWFWAPW